jgi:hypothetical protein
MTPEQILAENRKLKTAIIALFNERDISPQAATTALIELLASVLVTQTRTREAAHQGAQITFRTLTDYIDTHHGALHG